MLTIFNNYFSVISTSIHDKETGKSISRKQYLFGLFLLILFNILWVLSSELTKFIYTELKLERPFLVTYLRCSLLLVYLMVLCFTPPTKDPCQPADYTLLETAVDNEDDNFFNEANASLGDPTFVPVRAGEMTDSDDAAPRSVRFNKVAEVRVMSASQAGEALLARLSWSASVRATENAQRRAAAEATRRHLKMALIVSFPWFICNYLYRLSLLHTSTSITTIYLSTTSAMAISLGSMFTQSPSDRFTTVKCVAVLFTSGGLIIISTLSTKHADWTAVISALGASLFYSIHLVIIRRELRNSDGINTPLLAGLVGICVCAFAWVLGVALGVSEIESWSMPSPSLCSWLLFDALMGPLFFEALWIWGQKLTSSHTATTSLSLLIPISIAIDLFKGNSSYVEVLSAVFVLIGWVLSSTDQSVAEEGMSMVKRVTSRLHSSQSLTTLRNVQDLDEQSESLISGEELT